MGDHDRGQPELAVQGTVIVAERIAGEGIERAERLVHQYDTRFCRQCPRDADALALAARQFLWQAVAMFGAIEPHQVEQFVDPRRNLGGRYAQQFRGDADIAGDADMRKQPAALEHIADAAANWIGSSLRTSSPSTVTWPVSASISRLASRNSVVLPEPEPPTMARNSPSATSSETSSTASTGLAAPRPPKLLPTCANAIRGRVGFAFDPRRFRFLPSPGGEG